MNLCLGFNSDLYTICSRLLVSQFAMLYKDHQLTGIIFSKIDYGSIVEHGWEISLRIFKSKYDVHFSSYSKSR